MNVKYYISLKGQDQVNNIGLYYYYHYTNDYDDEDYDAVAAADDDMYDENRDNDDHFDDDDWIFYTHFNGNQYSHRKYNYEKEQQRR